VNNRFLLILLFILSFLLTESSLFGQKQLVIDSLNSKAYEIRNTDPDLAFLLASKAMKLAGSDTLESSFALSLRISGNAMHVKFDYGLSIDYLYRALKISERIHDSVSMSACHNNLYVVLSDQGKMGLAKNHLLHSLQIDIAIRDTFGIVLNMVNLADLYYLEGQADKAIDLNLQSARLSEEMGESIMSADIYNNLATICVQSNEPELSLFYLEKAIVLYEENEAFHYLAYAFVNMSFALRDMKRYDEGLLYINRAIDLLTEYNDETGLSNAILVKARILQSVGSTGEADSLFYVAMNMAMEQGNYRHLAEGFEAQGEFYLELKDTVQAIQLFQNSLEFARDMQYKILMIDVLQRLVSLFESGGDYEPAYHYLKELHAIALEMPELLTKPKLDLTIEPEMSLKELSARYERLLIWSGFVVFVLLVLFVVVVLKYRRLLRRRELSKGRNF